MARTWKQIRVAVADEVADRLWLGRNDTVVSEIRTADSRAEAIRRLKTIKGDCDNARAIVVKLTK